MPKYNSELEINGKLITSALHNYDSHCAISSVNTDINSLSDSWKERGGTGFMASADTAMLVPRCSVRVCMY
jgi:hypothetical protein